MLVQNSGGVSWSPHGQPVSCRRSADGWIKGYNNDADQRGVDSLTTDGTTPTLSEGVPQGTTTLYTGRVTVPSNAPANIGVQAIAYHASGTTTTSAVVTGQYVVAQEFVFDSGVTGATKFGTSFSQAQNWPGDVYDNLGMLVQANSGSITYD